MAEYNTLKLKERKARELEREQQLLKALSCRKKALEADKREKQRKKKALGELMSLLDLRSIEGATLRPVNTYVPKSHNLDRQVTGLLNHLYVRYPVPGFLYAACRKGTGDPFELMHEIYRHWFVALAQGGSFNKLVKSFMTSREAFTFLAAPAGNHIHENVWWAKMKVAGIPEKVIHKLNERIFSHYFFDDPNGRLAETILFYARYQAQMDRATFGEVTDFIAWKLRNERRFSLKGRTLSSVIRLTNEWHVLMQKAKLGTTVEWKGLGLPDWEHETKDRVWIVTELRDNKSLMNEGRKQRHCVYSYVSWCTAGHSAIFSLRCYPKIVDGYTEEGAVIWNKTLENSRVTVEVNRQREIVQVRGPLNRPPGDDEKKVLRFWTGEKGLVLRG
jgi:hypothetical protein